MIRRGVSTRRALVLVGLSDSSWRYRPRPRQDQHLVERLYTIARQHPRYGYRRACALLRRAGECINHKRVYRLWRAAKLGVPRRAPRLSGVARPIGDAIYFATGGTSSAFTDTVFMGTFGERAAAAAARSRTLDWVRFEMRALAPVYT